MKYSINAFIGRRYQNDKTDKHICHMLTDKNIHMIAALFNLRVTNN